ncbi:MAG: hypothetical protein ABJH52_17250 [Henriciella sp.]
MAYEENTWEWRGSITGGPKNAIGRQLICDGQLMAGLLEVGRDQYKARLFQGGMANSMQIYGNIEHAEYVAERQVGRIRSPILNEHGGVNLENGSWDRSGFYLAQPNVRFWYSVNEQEKRLEAMGIQQRGVDSFTVQWSDRSPDAWQGGPDAKGSALVINDAASAIANLDPNLEGYDVNLPMASPATVQEPSYSQMANQAMQRSIDQGRDR